jgi:hypothetical protein
MVDKVGIDRETAERVVAFLKEHAADLPGWLQSDTAQEFLNKARSSFGGLFGGQE